MLGRPGSSAAGQEERDRRRVIHRVGVHRLDEAEVVGDRRRVRQEVADPRAALAVLLEPGDRRQHELALSARWSSC